MGKKSINACGMLLGASHNICANTYIYVCTFIKDALLAMAACRE